MSQSDQQQMPPGYTQAPPQQKGSGLAVSALVLGIIALVFSFIPFINVVAIIMGIIGLVLGVIGIFKSKRTMSIIGSALCLIAIIVSIAISGAFASAVDDALDDENTGAQVTVVYTLESDAPNVTATYSTLDGGNLSQAQDTAAVPPWTTELTVEDTILNSFTLSGTMNPVLDGSAPDGSTITCRITVDGEVVAEQTSSGQYATVTCNAS